MVGVALELSIGSARTAFIYVCGVLCGSLLTVLVDTHVYLVGASGGVYALLAATVLHACLVNIYSSRHKIKQIECRMLKK